MNRIAIFGSKGYLGRQLLHYFTNCGLTCDGFDVPECDVTDRGFWDSFEPSGYDAVLFFAGLTGTEKGFLEADKYTAVNELGILNLLMRLTPYGDKSPRIIFPSTRLVYKGSNSPLKESAAVDMKTVYAVNKLACEGYLAAYSNRFDIPYNVIRICVPYGNIVTSEYSYGTIGFFLKQARENVSITLYGDGSVRRTFTHVEDICSAVKLMLSVRKNGIYNVGGDDLSLREVAEMIAKSSDASVSFVDWPLAAARIESGSTVFDSSALTRDFNWHAKHEFIAHVPEMIGK